MRTHTTTPDRDVFPTPRRSAMTTGPRVRGDAGYSLVELLLAMGLFSMLGVGLVALLSRAADFLTVGTSTAETLDALQTFGEAFGEDIATLYTTPDSETGVPAVRLYCDVVESKLSPEGKDKANICRFMFVRLIPNEGTATLTRGAGSTIAASAVMDQQNDSAESEAGSLKATGGLMEVFWTALPESASDLAVMRLYRGYRSPIGGAATLLPKMPATDPGATVLERGPVNADEVRAVAKPMLSGVLHFGVEFWSRKTTTWDGNTPAKNGGPLYTWDSSRGVLGGLSNRGMYDGFFYASRNGTASLADSTDDTFPRRVRVTLVVEGVGKNAKVGYLTSDLDNASKYVEVEDARFIPAVEGIRRFIKIGPEWIEFDGIEGNRLTGCKRGVRGTTAVAHVAGTPVHHGKTVIREYAIATFRDTYADDLPAIAGRR